MKRGELIGQMALVFTPPLLAGAAFCVLSVVMGAPLESTVIMLLLWTVGFLVFLKAKLSVIRQGKLISFGVRDMSQANRICYILGYGLMGLGLLLSLGIIAVYR